jgi:hypothetical protein
MRLVDMIRMPKMPVALCALLCASTASVVARTAAAAVCVEVDTSRDTLSEGDRNGTRVLLGQALEREGVHVAQENCAGTYSVYHVKLGNSITVFLQGPQGMPQPGMVGAMGYRQATARSLEDVPPVYSQMVRSLITGQPMNTANDTVDRTNATAAQQAPNRVEADSLWYARLGYGGALGPSFTHGPAFGFGYRYELDSLGIDLSFLNLMIGNNTDNNSSSGSVGVTGSWIKLMALYFIDPTANRTSYVGGGLGWGATAVASATNGSSTTNSTVSTYSGSGLQAELSVGYELLRASTIRIFMQLDATLPLYSVHSATVDLTTSNSSTSSSYAPSFVASFGIGWGRSITRVHVVN